VKAVYGLYADPNLAQQAVNNLRSVGVADADITVISSEPFEHFEFGHRDAKTAMPWIAAAAGLFGLLTTYYLLGASQMSWPLRTSGMPIVPLWTNLIIIFEMTMLSAILATVITLLITAGLPSRGGKLYDAEVSDGYILVGVENPSDGARLESALALDGGRVKKI
jgi:ActD protein